MHLEFLNQSTVQRRDLILNGSITRTVMFLAVPTLMLGVVQALMPLMDGLFINNVAGTLVASSVTYSEPVVNMMTALAQGFSVAAMAIIGQLNGRREFRRIEADINSDCRLRIDPGLPFRPSPPGRGSPDFRAR